MNTHSSYIISLILACCSSVLIQNQLFATPHKNQPATPQDSMQPKVNHLDEITTVASRLSNLLPEKLPYEIQIIDQSAIRKSSSTGLAEVLAEQSGLYVAGNPGSLFGTELQIMGLDAAYIQILEDGQPLIGRETGILNLQRIPSFFIRRIEIIKGAMTSLFGDNALAGIINIITAPPFITKPLDAEINFNSLGKLNIDLGTTIKVNHQNVVSLSASEELFGGYDHQADIDGNTIDPYTATSVRFQWIYKPNPQHSIRMQVKGFYNYIKGPYPRSGLSPLNNVTQQQDYSSTLAWNYKIFPEILTLKTTLVYSSYLSDYHLTSTSCATCDTTSSVLAVDTANAYSFQSHSMMRPSFILRWHNFNHATLSIGSDIDIQYLSSDRYYEPKQINNYSVYVQQEWSPKQWTFILGARLDIPDGFDLRLSPKIGIQYTWKAWTFNASLGTGYRSPDFRQQFMYFNHNALGYMVVGHNILEPVLTDIAQLSSEQVSTVVNDLTNLKEEKSLSAQIGINFKISKMQTISLWVFHNQIYDLIQSYKLPYRSAGNLSVFSYKNADKVYTQGFDIKYKLQVGKHYISSSFSFLEAREPAVEKKIDEGTLFGHNEKGESYRITPQDYQGLFQRPKVILSLTIGGSVKNWFEYNSTFRLQAGMGWQDKNGSNYFDDKDELAPNLYLLDIAIRKTLPIQKINLGFQFGVKNILNQMEADVFPTTNGRNFYLKLYLSI